jgi:hypothetical protein
VTTPKDIIAKVLRGHCDDANGAAREVIFSLAQSGFALTKRRVSMPMAKDNDDDGQFFAPKKVAPVDAPRTIDPDEQKRRLVEEMEATTAEIACDFIRDLQKRRSGLKK